MKGERNFWVSLRKSSPLSSSPDSANCHDQWGFSVLQCSKGDWGTMGLLRSGAMSPLRTGPHDIVWEIVDSLRVGSQNSLSTDLWVNLRHRGSVVWMILRATHGQTDRTICLISLHGNGGKHLGYYGILPVSLFTEGKSRPNWVSTCPVRWMLRFWDFSHEFYEILIMWAERLLSYPSDPNAGTTAGNTGI